MSRFSLALAALWVALAALAGPPVLGASPSAQAPSQIRRSQIRLEPLAIRIALESDPAAGAHKIRRHLGQLARRARRATLQALSLRERRERFNRFFFSEAGFKPDGDADSAHALLLHQVLERRQGTCVGLAQVYLILAERVGLPVVAAATPSHLLARWVDGEERINAELLEQGAEHSDAEYRARYRIAEAGDSRPIFLRDLRSNEVAARIYNNLGVIRSRAGLLEPAAASYDRAIELDPRFPAPVYNRALDELNTGRAKAALAGFDAALALYPADGWALNNRGLAKLRIGIREEAMEDFRRALAIEPELAAARKNLELVARHAAAADDARQAAPAKPEDAGTISGEPAAPRP